MENLLKTSGRSILVPPGISLKPTIVATIPVAVGSERRVDYEGQAFASFRLEYSGDLARYEIASFGLDRRETGVEITGALWRTIRVHSTIRMAIEMALPLWTRPITELRDRRRDGRPFQAPDFSVSDSDGLLLAAIAYRIGEISSEAPALAVAETLGLKQRTATNWIQRARDAGYMTSTDHAPAARRLAEELSRLNPPHTLTPDEASATVERHRAARRSRDGNH